MVALGMMLLLCRVGLLELFLLVRIGQQNMVESPLFDFFLHLRAMMNYSSRTSLALEREVELLYGDFVLLGIVLRKAGKLYRADWDLGGLAGGSAAIVEPLEAERTRQTHL